MIGLMFLAGIVVWLVVAFRLSRRIPLWLNMTRFVKTTQFLLFPVLVVLPVADEIIGRWQFKRLCERENVVHLSDDWHKVRRARSIDSSSPEKLNWYSVRIHKQEIRYQDIDTGEIFFSFNVYHNYGGLLMDRMGLRLSGAPPSCWPDGALEMYKKINLDQLVREGERK
ncbi:hypothetical protein [Ottowia sp.]|uniref:hypothetical protein n=1 Tax=Ottowia sp. TaxID=1898956 RepID=UPI0039E51E67